jgi:hypothetical protein
MCNIDIVLDCCVQEEIRKAFEDYQAGVFQDPKDDVWAAA